MREFALRSKPRESDAEDAVEKRYSKTIKGTKSGKTKPKFKVKPILEKGKIGIKIKGTF